MNRFPALVVLLEVLTVAAQGPAVWPAQTYVTEEFTPPDLEVTRDGATEPGYLFLAPSGNGVSTQSPLIFTDDNELVWHGPAGNFTYADFQVQMFGGEPHLTFWRGEFRPEINSFFGSVRILNKFYEEVAGICPDGLDVVTPGNAVAECYLDIHESEVTPQGTLIGTAYNVTQADLTSVGGLSNGWIFDGVFYEIDIATGEVLFRWRSSDHLDRIPLEKSKYPLEVFGQPTGASSSSPWDYFHINSVQKLSDGYLVNGRHFFSVYKVSFDGTIEWVLAGDDGGDFTLASDVFFSWQHKARLVSSPEESPQRLVFFNNDNSETQSGVNETTGLALDLNLDDFTVTKARELLDPSEPIFANSQGSYQPLSNQHVLLGYGQIAKIREFDGDGRTVYEATFGYSNATSFATNYRAYRSEWCGYPRTSPKAVVEDGTLFVSWNGATEVKSWRILVGKTCESLSAVDEVGKSGFESAYSLKGHRKAYVLAEALDMDIDGKSLAKSNCVPTA